MLNERRSQRHLVLMFDVRQRNLVIALATIQEHYKLGKCDGAIVGMVGSSLTVALHDE